MSDRSSMVTHWVTACMQRRVPSGKDHEIRSYGLPGLISTARSALRDKDRPRRSTAFALTCVGLALTILYMNLQLMDYFTPNPCATKKVPRLIAEMQGTVAQARAEGTLMWDLGNPQLR